MTAVQLLQGGGGWPMSVWLTPDREPFFGGTYFPPRDGARGMARGFLGILNEIADLYASDPERVRGATGPRVARRARRGPARLRRDRGGGGVVREELRPGARRRAPGPEVPVEPPGAPPPAPPPADARAGAAPDGDPHAREHGRGRDPRPARRRLPPLLDRRAVARPAL